MKKALQILLLVFLFAVLLVTVVSGMKSNQSSKGDESQQSDLQEYPDIGYLAPSFTLKDLEGNNHELKDYRGKPVILNFWASWCAPCIKEAPNFIKLASQYRDEVQILTVNLTSVDSIGGAEAFAEYFGFEFPTLLDEEGDVAASYQIKPIPTTFFIDSEGVITDGVYGGLTWEDLEFRTKRLIEESQSSD